eukprot:scaffold12443_cov108-Isochrysis_galbana.AAC.4
MGHYCVIAAGHRIRHRLPDLLTEGGHRERELRRDGVIAESTRTEPAIAEPLERHARARRLVPFASVEAAAGRRRQIVAHVQTL